VTYRSEVSEGCPAVALLGEGGLRSNNFASFGWQATPNLP